MSETNQTTAEQKSAAGNCLCGGKGLALSDMLRTLLPPEAANEHFRNARVEFLKGLREVIDQRIKEHSAPHQSHGTKLSVD